MGLITKTIKMNITPRNFKYYKKLGYNIDKVKGCKGKLVCKKGSTIMVNVEDLPKGSHAPIVIECDGCGIKLENIIWKTYNNYKSEDGKYYCHKCATNGHNKWINFEEWCISNNRQDSLYLWDYDKNKLSPHDISCHTKSRYWFKCKCGKHESELKLVGSFVDGHEGCLDCNQCNSFAQYLINTFGENGIEDYWDFEKNDKLAINPWKISKSEKTNWIWIKCQTKKHDSYPTNANYFSSGRRCPKCKESKGEKNISKYLDKFNISYIPQKSFEGLLGTGFGNLSYDFYLPQYNSLIEYQGEFHDGINNNFVKKNLETQLEHDKRKKEYAQVHNINLLEIWYWDFDNIEEILEQYLLNTIIEKAI